MALKHLKVQFLLLLILSGWFAYGQVGINTTTPLSTLDINGNLSVKTVTLAGGNSGSPTLIDDGVYISLDPRNGISDFYSLPNPTTVPGRVYIVRNITDFDTAKLSIDGGGGTIRFFNKHSNIGTFTLDLLPTNRPKTIILISDGFNWTYFD